MQPVLKLLGEVGILPAVNLDNLGDAVPLGKALVAGDVAAVRVSFSSDAAEETLRALASGVEGLIVCAEGVSCTDQVKRAVAAGARCVFTSGFDPEVIGYCLENEIAVVPRVESVSQIEAVLKMNLEIVRFFSAAPLDALSQLKTLSVLYPGIRYFVPEGIDPKKLCDYFAFDKVHAVGGDWIVDSDLSSAGRFDEITRRAREAVLEMHGFSLLHVGINCADAEQSMALAQKMAFLFGFAVRERPNSNFAGLGFELMKRPDRGEKGHLALGTRDAARASAFLERKGIRSLPGTERYNDDGTLRRIYLDLDIAGFAVHLRRY